MATSPLSSRVSSPGPAPLPASTDEIEWRPIRGGDEAELDTLMALVREVGLADHPNYIESRDEIEEELGHSWIDLERDYIVAVDRASGDFLAYGIVVEPPGQESLVREILAGGVRPSVRGRGLGRELLAWQEARGLERLSHSDKPHPGWLMAYADDRAPSASDLFVHVGFEPTRYFIGVTRDISEPIPDLPLPEGIRLTKFVDELSDSTLHAYQESFRDHWGSQPATAEQWESWCGMDDFKRDLSVQAVDADGQVIGFLITFVTESDWELQGFSSGYMQLVGVVREWRRKGIAPALLAEAFRAYRAAGLERAVLDVDSDNPSGAVGLYSGMGFVEATKSASYLKIY